MDKDNDSDYGSETAASESKEYSQGANHTPPSFSSKLLPLDGAQMAADANKNTGVGMNVQTYGAC